MSAPVPAEKLAEWVDRMVDAATDIDDGETWLMPSDYERAALAAVLPDVLAYATARADSDSMVEASVECPSCGASIRAHVRDGGAS